MLVKKVLLVEIFFIQTNEIIYQKTKESCRIRKGNFEMIVATRQFIQIYGQYLFQVFLYTKINYLIQNEHKGKWNKIPQTLYIFTICDLLLQSKSTVILKSEFNTFQTSKGKRAETLKI